MTVKPGDNAPAFNLFTDGGNTLAMKDLKGKKVILYFYPKDDTSGCTKEAIAFGEALSEIKDLGGVVVGVSRDSVARHDKFKSKYNLPFTLVADEDCTLCEAYGVWVEKSMYGRKYMGIDRSTFLIDATGKVHEAWRKVKVPGHAEAVLQSLRSL
ncbi:MAG: thioredoxin-dependent thiol peroxidase [Rhodospirillales bacterium]|jgi:peroxiredoxin Q/BCP